MSIRRLKSSGDTIVEVLLAIAVLGAVLSAAYVSANRSQKNIRQAQERGEALQFVQAQLELIKDMATNDQQSGALFSEIQPFCIIDSSYTIVIPPAPGCSFGTDGRYGITVQRTVSGTGHLFTVTAVWDNVIGSGQDNITSSYRIQQ